MTAKKIFTFLAAAVIIAAMIFFLIDPARYGGAVSEGVSLWAVCVLPAVFPFLFLTALLTRLPLFGRFAKTVSPLAKGLFRVSGAGGCAAVMAALSGYPVGARCVLDLYENGLVKGKESFRLACLSTTSGPMFLIGTVGGGMLQSPLLGVLLLVCHFAAVWTVSFFLRFTGEKNEAPPVYIKPQGGLYESLYSSVISVLCVGGSIALFYAFGQMACDVLRLSPALEGWVRGVLEMTSGCKLLAQERTPLSLAGCAFFVTFGGLCVLVQQFAFLSRAGVKAAPFLLVKFIQGILAGILMFALSCAIL